MTYVGVIEWCKPHHRITEHSVVTSSNESAIEHFKEVATEGYGEVLYVHAVVPVYTRALGQ